MRRAFTLMETMLAAGIASIVVLACLSLMYAMNRTDRSMEVRAQQRSDLGRVRTVMSRALTSLLLSDERMNTGNPAAPSDDAIFDGRPMTGSNQRSRGAASSVPIESDKADKAGADKGDASSEPKDEAKGAGKIARVIKPPPPPRIILGVDQRVNDIMRFRTAPDAPEAEAGVQRLELVLHRSPVPTAKIDPMDMPLPPRSSQQRSRAAREESATDTQGSVGAVAKPAPAATDEELITPDEEAALPVRALRGAFELRPQPPIGYRPPGNPTLPAASDDRSFPHTGLWELWWIPLPPAGADEHEVSRNESLFSGIQQPYFVAGNLKYAQWTVFFRRSKRPDLVSTWRADLPAYIEFKVETAAGLQANWMFEVDWAEGPEVARRPDEKPKAGNKTATAEGDGSDKTDASTGRPRVNRPAASSGGARPLPRPSERSGKGSSTSPSRGAK